MEEIKEYFKCEVDFFKQTSKPLLLIQNVGYQIFKEELKGYEVIIEGEEDDLTCGVVVGKSGETLLDYKEVNTKEREEYFYSLGKLLGYPETAVKYFSTENGISQLGKRYSVNYHGLRFVCKQEDIELVKDELYKEYGLPFDDTCTLREF